MIDNVQNTRFTDDYMDMQNLLEKYNLYTKSNDAVAGLVEYFCEPRETETLEEKFKRKEIECTTKNNLDLKALKETKEQDVVGNISDL